jgi:hypothetical protein
MLAQYVSGFDFSWHNFNIKEKSMQKKENELNHSQIYSNEIRADLGDWRTPISCYLCDPSANGRSSAWTLFKQKW